MLRILDGESVGGVLQDVDTEKLRDPVMKAYADIWMGYDDKTSIEGKSGKASEHRGKFWLS